MSLIFHLLFLCLLVTLTSCSDKPDYDFKSSYDAISEYRDFHHSLRSLTNCKAEDVADKICQWQELSDTVYNFIRKDPAFTAHAGLSVDFGLVTDSVRTELMRLTDKCTMKDVAYIKMNTSPYRDDDDIILVRKKAQTFFDALDKQPIYNKGNVREMLSDYRRFLYDTRANGIKDQKQLLAFMETEDRHFRTFLAHIDEYSDMGLSEITSLTENICSQIYKAASEHKITSEDAMVFMSMRTDRRLLLNAQVCCDLLRKGNVKSGAQANAYLWMMIQPYLSMDSFAVTMLTDSQKQQMLDIADCYPTFVSQLGARHYINVDASNEIPTQLMRLYISTL